IALIFAPEGYPLAIPIIQAKLPMPGILNKGRIIGSNKTPINFTTPKRVNNSAAIKNGSKDGNTTLHYISSPRILAWKLVSVNIIMESEINKSINAMNIVYNFCFNLLPPQRYGYLVYSLYAKGTCIYDFNHLTRRKKRRRTT